MCEGLIVCLLVIIRELLCLVYQLMSMSEEDLDKLPPDGRERMLSLREQILGQMGQQQS